jgi:ATP-dependent exoDNAse (exonuclease V) beta subunit
MDAVAKSVVNFWNWMEQKYGKPTKIERESPFTFTNEMGQIVTGEIDLVYHTATGDVLVDYKTYQGKMADLTDENSNFYAGKYGGQLALYSEALSRNGNTIRDRLICYLSLGAVVSISFQQ